MADDLQNEGQVALGQREHHGDAGAKKVVLRAQDPDSGDWVNLGASDLGDGTFGFRGTGLIPYRFTQIQFSNPNGNTPPNYQTGTVKNGSTTIGSLDLSYDGSGTLTNVTFTAS
jgi:hypothetical protein